MFFTPAQFGGYNVLCQLEDGRPFAFTGCYNFSKSIKGKG